MSQPYTQENRIITLETPLGKDKLLVTSFSGTETISGLFRFEVEALSRDASIRPADLAGKAVTVTIDPEAGGGSGGERRFFHGIVGRFVRSSAGNPQDPDRHFTAYRFTMLPEIWLLTLSADLRIFQKQGQDTAGIVKTVLDDMKIGTEGSRVSIDVSTRRKRDYCVQYRESHFNFISRLLEEEGISWYFRHEKGSHTLVVTDSPGQDKLPDAIYRQADSTQVEAGSVLEFDQSLEVVSTAVHLGDYNFEIPATDIGVNCPAAKKPVTEEYPINDYPGKYRETPDGDFLARRWMEGIESMARGFEGQGSCHSFTAGCRFRLEGHPEPSCNDEYLLVSVTHEAKQGFGADSGGQSSYRNRFGCVPYSSGSPFRPPRVTPRPSVAGLQTAVVVREKGESSPEGEIVTDKYGRIRVRFHWYRPENNGDKTSCWVRVAQLWAGKGWGGLFIPRVGQEVVVDFLEGDPDRPVVVGCLYNAANMPPYPLPGEKTKSAIRSSSTPDGETCNEIRFDDDKGNEQLFIYAGKDQHVRTKKELRGLVGGDSHLTVKGRSSGSVGGAMDLSVGGDLNEKVGGTLSIKAMDLQGKTDTAVALEAGTEVHIKGGATVVIEAGVQLTIKAGGNFVDIGPAGVTIQGSMVNINSGGAPGSGGGASPKAPSAPKEPDDTAYGKS